MHIRLAIALLLLVVGVPMLPRDAAALPGVVAYNDSSAFRAALLESIGHQTFTFDTAATPAGLVLPQPTVDNPYSNRIRGYDGPDLFLGYDRALAPLMIADRYDTTSGERYLGTSDGANYNQLVAGDQVSLVFNGPISALGMFFITADRLVAGDIELVTAVGTVSNAAGPELILPDGGLAYFIGLTSQVYTFRAGVVRFNPDAYERFLYNIDDIETARLLPAPGSLLLSCSGLVLLACLRRKTAFVAGVNAARAAPTNPGR